MPAATATSFPAPLPPPPPPAAVQPPVQPAQVYWGQPQPPQQQSYTLDLNPPIDVGGPPPQQQSRPLEAGSFGSVSPIGGHAADPIARLDDSQTSSIQQIAASIPDLALKEALCWYNENIAGMPCTLDARDAPGPANVAWLASVHIPGKLSSLTIFNGPLTDVPHLLSRCCVLDDGSLNFALDFRPRAYGAYEMKDANGNYPGPDEIGRKAFEYSYARDEFQRKFAVDVQDFLRKAVSKFENAMSNPPTQLDLLTGGPLAIDVTMPLTDRNLEIVATLRETAEVAWLRWALDSDLHAHRPGAPVNSQYVYDAKHRQNAYLALKDFYSSVFGPVDGAKLAAAESGPLDEAYVGGGS